MRNLYYGINLLVNGVELKVKAILFRGILDNPMVRAVCELNSHSGYCSCMWCLITGVKKGKTAVYFPIRGKNI
jgi:hypothetical protein